MNNRLVLSISGILLAWMSMIFHAGCGKTEPIPVGYSGQLSGAYADLGIKGRDGVLLAVENINAAGGISGRPIKLLVRDDKGSPEGARAADQALIEAGVVAIIGHMTSGQTVAAINVTENSKTVLLSPTASTIELAGRDDHFFRVVSTSVSAARLLARHMRLIRKLFRPAIVSDIDNAAFTDTYKKAFSDEIKAGGGRVAGTWNFSSSIKPDFDRITRETKGSAPDSLLIIASPLDTAIIAQKIRTFDQTIPLFASAWAHTDTLIQHGGGAVEGMEIVIDFNSNSQQQEFRDFRAGYLSKFGHEPTFAGSFAYEAMLVLAAGLEKTKGRQAGLRNVLLGIQNFKGLAGTISFDPYGDVIRPHFVCVVENGDFAPRESIVF